MKKEPEVVVDVVEPVVVQPPPVVPDLDPSCYKTCDPMVGGLNAQVRRSILSTDRCFFIFTYINPAVPGTVGNRLQTL